MWELKGRQLFCQIRSDVAGLDFDHFSGSPILDLDHALGEAFVSNGHVVGSPDQVGIIKFHPGAFIAIIPQDLHPCFC